MGLEPAAALKPTLTAPPGEPASLSESQAQKYHGLSLVLAEEGETHFWREGGSPPSWGDTHCLTALRRRLCALEAECMPWKAAHVPQRQNCVYTWPGTVVYAEHTAHVAF